MPDISMCPGEFRGEICPLREACYRYMAKPDGRWQTWMIPATFGIHCEDYWPNGKSVKKEKSNDDDT